MSLTKELKIRAPDALIEQLKQESETHDMNFSAYTRKKLAGTLQTQSENDSIAKQELLQALNSFFLVFQSAYEDKRLRLNQDEIKKLKEVQEVANRHV